MSMPAWKLEPIHSIKPNAQWIEPRTRVWEIGSSIPSQVKPMLYKIDTCYFLARRSALIG